MLVLAPAGARRRRSAAGASPPCVDGSGCRSSGFASAALLRHRRGIAPARTPGSRRSGRSAAALAVAERQRRSPASQAVYPSDKHGDWLLWKEPSLRGRVAYDVRFELLTSAQLTSRRPLQVARTRAGSRLQRAIPILVFDPTDGKARIRTLRREPARRCSTRTTRSSSCVAAQADPPVAAAAGTSAAPTTALATASTNTVRPHAAVARARRPDQHDRQQPDESKRGRAIASGTSSIAK